MGYVPILPPYDRPRLSWRKRIEYFFFPGRRKAEQALEHFMNQFESTLSRMPSGSGPVVSRDYDERRDERLDGYAELSNPMWDFLNQPDFGSPSDNSYPDASGGGFDGFGGGDGGGGGATGSWE